MVIHGHIQNGLVVPDSGITWPDGTEVVISLPGTLRASNNRMAPDEHARYLEALRRIDAIDDEQPSDDFSGVDHDRVLYGAQK